jgi:hypothetical protein
MGSIFKVAPGCESLLSGQGLDGVEAVFRWGQGERLDKPGLEGWRQRWRIVLPEPGGARGTYYLKRFTSPPFCRQLERWRSGGWWQSTAGTEFENARQLAQAEIPAAEAVAFGQDNVGPWERRSFILLREVPGVSLERWVPDNLFPADQERDCARRRERLDDLARSVAKFHRAGFVHRDLYLSHIFIQPGRAAGGDVSVGRSRDEFRLIDLQRVFRPRRRHRRWVVKDLAALNYSTPIDRVGPRERLRFLCRYVRLCDRFGTARGLARLVQAKTDRMTARHRTGVGAARPTGTAAS